MPNVTGSIKVDSIKLLVGRYDENKVLTRLHLGSQVSGNTPFQLSHESALSTIPSSMPAPPPTTPKTLLYW